VLRTTGRHRARFRLGALGATLLALSCGGAYALEAGSGQAHADTTGDCGAFASVTAGKHWINNNTWGASGATGWSCV
jgi:hypothetical protein